MKTEYENSNLEAAKTLGKALINEQYLQSPMPGLSGDLFNLGLVYDNLNQLDKAASLYTESLHLLKSTEYEAIAGCITNLAGVFERMKVFELALFFYMQAKHVSKHYLGKDHPVYADTLYNLANLAAKMNNNDEALSLHEEALAIREKLDNPKDISDSLHSLAFINEELGEYKKATSYSEAALDKVSGTDYTKACTYLAELYETTQQHNKALDMYIHVMDQISKNGCTLDDYTKLHHRKTLLGEKVDDTIDPTQIVDPDFFSTSETIIDND